MFRYMLGGGSIQSYVISILLALPIVLLSLSAHEAAHGYAALKLGDPTARNFGRITLNPMRHLDPIGFLCMLLAGFGWAQPVPINTRNFRKPRRDMALSVLFLLLLRFVGYGWLAGLTFSTELTFNLAYFSILFLYYGVSMNLTLAIFNLLPVPPLDGSRILYVLLPPRILIKIAPYERYISLAVMLLLLLGPLSWLIQLAVRGIMGGMFTLVGMRGFLI